MVLEVQRFMEVSFANVTSRLDHKGNILLEGAQTAPPAMVSSDEPASRALQNDHAIDSQTGLSDGDTNPQLWLSRMASDERSPPRMAQRPASDSPTTITITSTLRPTCPPNCRCQCHMT